MKKIKVNPRLDRPHSRNVMPQGLSETVGPFIYFDHLGPFDFPKGKKVYIPPHPHAGIATISYMFEGMGHHRDSLGNDQILDSGRVNWMKSGNGIVHSEGLPEEFSQKGGLLNGFQIWTFLSPNERQSKANFESYADEELPTIVQDDLLKIKLLVGNYQNEVAPVQTENQLVLLAIDGKENATQQLTLNPDWQYLFYSLSGKIVLYDKESLEEGEGVFLEQYKNLNINIRQKATACLLGGPKLKESPIFNGSLVAGSVVEMKGYIQQLQNSGFGKLKY